MHNLRENDKKMLKNALTNENFNQGQINAFLDNEYDERYIADIHEFRYVIELYRSNMTENYIMARVGKETFNAFQNFLKENELSIDDAMQIYRWSMDHNEILKIKRNNASKTMSYKDYFFQTLSRFGLAKNDILNIYGFAKELSKINDIEKIQNNIMTFLRENRYSIALCTTLLKFVESQQSLEGTVDSLEKSLTNQISRNIVVYRVIDQTYLQKFIDKIGGEKNIIGSKMEDKGFTSTSFRENNMFRELNADNSVLIKIFVPKGSQGLEIAGFSKYPYEYEILFNSNDLLLFDYDDNFVDKDGKTKTLLHAMLLSKDRNCYKDISKDEKTNIAETYETEEENE